MADTTIVQNVSEGITDAFRTADTFAESAIDGAADAVTTVIDKSADGLTGVVDGTANLAKGFISTSKDVIDSGFTLVKNGLDATAKTFTGLATGITSGVGTGMQSGINTFNDAASENVDAVLSVSWVLVLFKIVIILYAAKMAPQISSKYAPVVSNSYFRVGVIALLVWVYSHDPVASVLIAVAWFMTINYLRHNAQSEVEKTGMITPNAELAMTQNYEKSQPQNFPGAVIYNNQTINTPMVSATGQVKNTTQPIPHDSLVSANIPNETHALAAV